MRIPLRFTFLLVAALLFSPALAPSAPPDVPRWTDVPESTLTSEGSARIIVELHVHNIRDLTRASTSVRLPDALDSPGTQPAPAGADATLARAIRETASQVVRRLPPDAHRIIRHYDFVPFLALAVKPEALAALQGDPLVQAVHWDIPIPLPGYAPTGQAGTLDTLEALDPDHWSKPTMADTIALIGADQAWSKGFTGSGWHVAILDTGIRRTHQFFAGKTIVEACFSSEAHCPDGQTSMIGNGAAAHHPGTYQGHDHGTHVAGIAAGQRPDGTLLGVARDADIIAVNVFSRFSAGQCGGRPCVMSWTSDQIAGLDYVYSLRQTLNVGAVNMSLGGARFTTYCDTRPQKRALDLLRDANIPTAIATGNDGFCGATGAPACISSGIAVMASTKDDRQSSFSNWHSTIGDIFAPGQNIQSATGDSDTDYASRSGTSMAAPHMAGALTLMRQYRPGEPPAELLARLQELGPAITTTCPDRGSQRRLFVDNFRFTDDHTVTATAGAGGTVTPATTTAGHRSTASFVVLPQPGYVPGTVSGTCAVGSFSGTTYTTGAIIADCAVQFAFDRMLHAITLAAGPGGSVSGGGPSPHGTEAVVTAAATAGHAFVNWTEGGTEVSTDPVYRFTVTSPRTLTANFTAVHGSLSVTINPAEVRAQARWKRADARDWRESGTVESAIPQGVYTVVFQSVPGWITPTSRIVTISGTGTIALSGGYIRATHTFTPLNDTGIQFCALRTSGNNASCTGTEPGGQDAHHGRDAQALSDTLHKTGSGAAGFDFTKISNSGAELPAAAPLGSGPDDWACTRDNTSGLYWEVKVNDPSHPRHGAHRYTWYFTGSPDGRPGAAGTTATCANTLHGQNCSTENYSAAVNAQTLCGFADWRVPTASELESIVHLGQSPPTIDHLFFPGTSTSAFWSATPSAHDPGLAWHVTFSNGRSSFTSRENPFRILLTRGSQAATPPNISPPRATSCLNGLSPGNPDARYRDNGDGTATDIQTGLTWKRCAEGQTWDGTTCTHQPATFTWHNALLRADAASFAGHTDWRLPNVKELRSLVEQCRVNPAVNPFFFPNLPASYFWTASPDFSEENRSWLVSFDYGHSSSYFRDGLLHLLLTRGGRPQDLTGSVTVSISPDEVRNAGAQWRRVGTTEWHESGATVKNVPPGAHTLEFRNVTGWTTPGSIHITVQSGQTTTADIVYAKNTYSITATTHQDNRGNVFGGGTYQHGTQVTLTAIPKRGYTFVNWTEANNVVSHDATYVFSANTNRRLFANFSVNMYRVEAISGTGGRVFPGSLTVEHGKSGVFTVTPETGYIHDIATGSCPQGIFNKNMYTTGTIANNCSVNFSFIEIYSRAIRNISDKRLCIAITPPDDTRIWSVQENIPTGLNISDITGNGQLEAQTRIINWGPFYNTSPQQLCYSVDGSEGNYTFSGSASFNGLVGPVFGDDLIVIPGAVVTHPADTDENWNINRTEATAYSHAWLSNQSWHIPPNPIDINYVTRAGYLWKKGESYLREQNVLPPSCWVPSSQNPNAQSVPFSEQSVYRTIEMINASTASITIVFGPAREYSSYAIEERIPRGLTPGSISDNGVWDPDRQLARWAFLDNAQRRITYELTGDPGFSQLHGTYSIDGFSQTLPGMTLINPDMRRSFLPGVYLLLLDEE